MKDIVIFGSGALGREVAMLLEQINGKSPLWNILGFCDDAVPGEKVINGYPYLGNIDFLLSIERHTAVVIAIGNPGARKRIHDKIISRNLYFPTLIHPNVLMGNPEYVSIDEGTIITAGNIITVNIKIGKFVLINLTCTIGHDTIIGDYVSVMPGANISGTVRIADCVYIGTGAKIINNLEIGRNCIVGAGAVVSRSLPPDCTAVGVPAKAIKFHK